MEVEDKNMTEIKLNLASFLTHEINKRNTSLSRLSEEVNVPKTCLHSWSNGISPKLNEKNLQYLERLANYFNTTVHKMILTSQNSERISDTLFESTFRDGPHLYRLRIEKITE